MPIPTDSRERALAAVAVTAVHALLLYAFVSGLSVSVSRKVDDTLKLFAVMPLSKPPQARPPIREQREKPRKEGAASAPNLRSRAIETLAVAHAIRIPVQPVVLAAPVPQSGNDASTGSAEIAGSGTGAGGSGNGIGSGDGGDGDGAGDGTPPRRIGGYIKDSDFPPDAAEQGMRGTVAVRYRVGMDGRASGCIVTGSSGFPELDQATCRIIEQRFRYAPALDEQGRPVGSIIVENHSWIMER